MASPATERLIDRAPELSEFGLVIERFGPDAVVIRENPALLGALEARSLLPDLADERGKLGETPALRERLERVCGTLACHGSARAVARSHVQSPHTSITRLVLGLEQQISTQPGSGWSSGCSRYSTSPSTNSHMQVWQIPERQL